MKSKLFVVGLLIELINDNGDESEKYNDYDNILMELSNRFQVMRQHMTEVVFSNITYTDASTRHLH